MTRPRAFIECETLGLDRRKHAVWEVACIIEGTDDRGEYVWQLHLLDDEIEEADPRGIEISGFNKRYNESAAVSQHDFAEQFVRLTAGCSWVGNVPSFDEYRIEAIAYEHNLTPRWHYQLIDVEALAVGWLNGVLAAVGYLLYEGENGGEVQHNLSDGFIMEPGHSEQLMRMMGVEGPTEEERHTALGDCRWAQRVVYHWVCRDMGLSRPAR